MFPPAATWTRAVGLRGRRPQITYVIPPATEIQKINKEPAKTPMENLGPMQLQKTTKNIGPHIELINWKDNLWKMERKLKRTVNFKLQNIIW